MASRALCHLTTLGSTLVDPVFTNILVCAFAVEKVLVAEQANISQQLQLMRRKKANNFLVKEEKSFCVDSDCQPLKELDKLQ